MSNVAQCSLGLPDLKIRCDKDVQAIWAPAHSLSSRKALINLTGPVWLPDRPHLNDCPFHQST